MRKPTKKTTAIIVAAVTVLAGGGAAFAYWTAGGSGTGSASTTAATSGLTAVQTSTVTAMQPGDSAQTLSGNFTNPNSSPIYVSTVTASIARRRPSICPTKSRSLAVVNGPWPCDMSVPRWFFHFTVPVEAS